MAGVGLLGRPQARRRLVLPAVGAAVVVLLVAAVVLTPAQQPSELFEWQPDASQRVYQHARLSPVAQAKRDYQLAQQRVEHDMARLRHTEGGRGAQLHDMSFSVFPKHGPTADLEDDENTVSTPRAAHYPKFGANKRHCPGGNCETLDHEGVATDRWPVDIYSGMPNPAWDPEANPKRLRDMNMRTGDFEGNMHKDTYHPPVQWGANRYAEGGSMAAEDRGAKRLEEAGVVHDKWPFDVYKAMPNPAWDVTEQEDKSLSDPYDTILENQGNLHKLHEAGVRVNGLPTDLHSRTYNHVDGIYDRMVPVDAAPRWRKGGVGRQEEPGHFLLRSGGIEGALDDPQPAMDFDLGVEKEPEEQAAQAEPEEEEEEEPAQEEEEEPQEEPQEEPEQEDLPEEEEDPEKRLAGLHTVQ